MTCAIAGRKATGHPFRMSSRGAERRGNCSVSLRGRRSPTRQSEAKAYRRLPRPLRGLTMTMDADARDCSDLRPQVVQSYVDPLRRAETTRRRHSSPVTRPAGIANVLCFTLPSGRRRQCGRAYSGTSLRSSPGTWRPACLPARHRRTYLPRGRVHRAFRRARSGIWWGNRR